MSPASLVCVPGMRGSLLAPLSSHPYLPPVPPHLFLGLWIGLLALGIAFTGWFFVYQVSVSGASRSVLKELTLSGLASALVGFGVIFLMLWAGVWV